MCLLVCSVCLCVFVPMHNLLCAKMVVRFTLKTKCLVSRTRSWPWTTTVRSSAASSNQRSQPSYQQLLVELATSFFLHRIPSSAHKFHGFPATPQLQAPSRLHASSSQATSLSKISGSFSVQFPKQLHTSELPGNWDGYVWYNKSWYQQNVCSEALTLW